MAKITQKMIETTYISALSVINGGLTEAEATLAIKTNSSINPNSAKMYLRCAIALLTGKYYSRTVNGQAMDYYFAQIKKDFGHDGLSRALQSFDKHIACNSNPQLNLQEIADKYRK